MVKENKTEDKKKQEEKKVEEKKEAKIVETKEKQVASVTKEASEDIIPKEEKKEAKQETKKEKKKEKPSIKKEEAIALGRNLHISKKHGIYICSFIKKKKIDDAINDLDAVKKFKKAVPFKGEIPHRKGKGIMSGRYPVKGAGLFISVLKGLKGNVIVNGLDLDKTRIYYASANWGSRPMRSKRREGKRTNVILKAKEMKLKEVK